MDEDLYNKLDKLRKDLSAIMDSLKRPRNVETNIIDIGDELDLSSVEPKQKRKRLTKLSHIIEDSEEDSSENKETEPVKQLPKSPQLNQEEEYIPNSDEEAEDDDISELVPSEELEEPFFIDDDPSISESGEKWYDSTHSSDEVDDHIPFRRIMFNIFLSNPAEKALINDVYRKIILPSLQNIGNATKKQEVRREEILESAQKNLYSDFMKVSKRHGNCHMCGIKRTLTQQAINKMTGHKLYFGSHCAIKYENLKKLVQFLKVYHGINSNSNRNLSEEKINSLYSQLGRLEKNLLESAVYKKYNK